MLSPRDASSINLPPSNTIRPFSDPNNSSQLRETGPRHKTPPGGELCRDCWLEKVCRTPKKSPLWYIWQGGGGLCAGAKGSSIKLQRTNIAIQMTKENWRDPAGGSRYDGKKAEIVPPPHGQVWDPLASTDSPRWVGWLNEMCRPVHIVRPSLPGTCT